MRQFTPVAVLALVSTSLPHTATAHGAGALPTCPGQTPAAVVRSYYAALVRSDKAGQFACFTPYYRRQLSAPNVIGDWNNVISLRITRLHVYFRAPGNRAWTLPGDAPRAQQVVQVIVEYVVHYRRIIDSPNGKGLRFIYVVKQHVSSPWRIAGIGSGP